MAGQLSHMWYVKAADRVWGPYPEERIASFVQEGRVGADTPVSPFATGPFAPAAANPEFGPLLNARAEAARAPAPPAPAAAPGMPSVPAEFAIAPQAQAAAPARAAPAAAPAPRGPAPTGPAPRGPAPESSPASQLPPDPEVQTAAHRAEGPERRLLVWASLSDEGLRTFPAALAAFGPGVAIRSGLWLVRVRLSAPALRNLLSRRLGPQDSLLVVEADLERAAWFNVDPGRDRELRRLWAGAGPG